MLLALLVLAAAPKTDGRLVGNWQLNSQPFLTLNANGSGNMDGDPVKWRAEGNALVITDDEGEVEKVPFTLEGDALTLNVGGIPMALRRGGAAPPKTSKLARAAEKQQRGTDEEAEAEAMALAQQYLAQQQKAQGGQRVPQGQGQPMQPQAQPRGQPAGNDQLSRLLLSSNWCWLRYASGNTYTQKVHFNANGTWEDFSESDIYVSNPQVVAQATGNRTNGGQWAVKNGQLWLSSPENPQLAPVPLSITRNSNGYPIINADGREYSMCN